MFWSVEVSAGTRGIRRESRVGRDAGGVVCVRLGIGCGLRGILPCGASTLRAWLSLGHGNCFVCTHGPYLAALRLNIPPHSHSTLESGSGRLELEPATALNRTSPMQYSVLSNTRGPLLPQSCPGDPPPCPIGTRFLLFCGLPAPNPQCTFPTPSNVSTSTGICQKLAQDLC